MADAPRRNTRPAGRRGEASETRAQKQAAKKAADKQAAKQQKRDARAEKGRRRSPVRGALLAVLCVGLLFAFVYPTRTFLDQRDQMNRAKQQLSVLEEQNKKLVDQSKKLQSDAEIERLAREKYGLVKPGEKAFVIVPTPTTTVPPPPSTYPGNP
ncbi:MAG: septum formation initiator family protein [Acidimicrobiia bacterium]